MISLLNFYDLFSMAYCKIKLNMSGRGNIFYLSTCAVIQTRLKDGWCPNRIAKVIGCVPNTVRKEIKRGTVALYRRNILSYKATAGQATYEQNRQVCCRH